MKNVQKILAAAMVMTLISTSVCACGKKAESSGSSDGSVAGVAQDTEGKEQGTPLVNHMTDAEKASIQVSALQVLDEPWESALTGEEGPYSEGIYVEVDDAETIISYFEQYPTDDEDTVEFIEKLRNGAEYYCVSGACVDGRVYSSFLLPQYEYDGGSFWVSVYEEGEWVAKEFTSFEELKEQLPEILKEYRQQHGEVGYVCYSTDDSEQITADLERIYEEMRDGEYERISWNDMQEMTMHAMDERYGNVQDYSWELDTDAVAAIADQVTEYHIHDEEMNRDFVIHVAVPKGYDAEKTYPAIVLTDAVWRFNDIAKLLSEMDAGRAEPQILISIGQGYSICNSDNVERSAVFCEGKDKFLDFITDNLMPYLGELYHIDNANSVLYGHSLGGVFTHYALFNSDLYENQPFGCYIIGSPAFWSPYSREMSDYSEQANDYGYFDRNSTLNKSVLITAGSLEDDDYEEYFEDGDSTTESIEHLKEKILSHGVEDGCFVIAKLYESHHYQYIPDMLIEVADGKIEG